MPTRRAVAAPRSGRVHRRLAAVLVCGFLAGCAQVLGLEEWKAVDCEDNADDPAECDSQASCTECLFGPQSTCMMNRQACADDMTSCAPILQCSQTCQDEADSVACVKACCTSANGNELFDVYLTCLCEACADACGLFTQGCQDYCNPM